MLGRKSYLSQLLRSVVYGGLVTTLVSACGGGSTSEDNSEAVAPPASLQSGAVGEELESYIKAGFSELNAFDFSLDQADGGVATSTVAGGSAQQVFSETNVQVEGVDEADIWKFNGRHFYSVATDINSRLIQVFKPDLSDGTGDFIGAIELDFFTNQLYLDETQLTALSSNRGSGYWGFPYRYEGEHFRVVNFDISSVDSNTADVAPTIDITIDGALIDSRKIDDQLYLLSRYTPGIPGWERFPRTEEEIALNQALLEQAELETLLPSFLVNNNPQNLIADTGCHLLDEESGYAVLTSLTRVNLTTGEVTNNCIAGPMSGLYMTNNNAYLLRYIRSFDQTINNTVDNNGSTAQTEIHKFALNSQLNYLGFGAVNGVPSCDTEAFCFGELEDESLALVTTSNRYAREDIRHQLFVLSAEDLSVQAQLPNDEQPQAIGKPGELLYSARFLQNRVYLVTFAKVDPLYTIDLTDSQNPRILGELEIPGYSDYLHPINDELLIGVGRDAQVGISGTVWYQGLKVDLYDVADLTNPIQLESYILGRRGSNTPVEYNHRAFSFVHLDDQFRFILPVSINEGEVELDSVEPERTSYPFAYSGFQAFEVDIVADGLSRMNPLPPSIIVSAEQNNFYNRYYPNARSTIIGDTLYYFFGGEIFASDWTDTGSVSAFGSGLTGSSATP